ncbi:MAG: tetratricopeptide repeat protein [Candidatus Omnitrophica bacterium]|nr:tetratricopeptide repeat protein [Candidatus Omnitrophota bacterium]
MKPGFRGKAKSVFLSVGFFYIVAGTAVTLYVKDHQALGIAKLRALNRYMPALTELAASNRSATDMDPDYARSTAFYYRKVTDYLPQNPNGYFMLGYCLAGQGKDAQAVKAFAKSAELNPAYFWSHYNLGIARLRLGQLDEAEEAFRAALKADPGTTVKVIFASKVFQQLLPEIRDPQAVILPGLKGGYQDCQRWIAVIGRLKALSQKELPPDFYNQLRPVIF